VVMKHLVVVPDGNPVFPIWSIEYALKLVAEGNEVHFLNLQELNSFIFRRKFKKAVFEISRKNKSSHILSKLCKDNGIIEHKAEFLTVLSNKISLKSESEEIFKLAMSSKYGAKFGSRYVSLDQIPTKTVDFERMFFDLAYQTTQNLIKTLKIERLTTVNGRLIVSAATVAAARNLEVPVQLLESVNLAGDRYHIFDRSPHDLREMSEAHEILWSTSGDFREVEAQSYLDNRYGEPLITQSSKEYDFSQEFELKSRHQKLASFFPTTETEFPVFSDFYTTSTFQASQQNAFRAFAAVAREFGFNVIVRAHPQNSDFQNIEINEDAIWRSLCSETGAEFISASSRINSYDLVNKSDICVTYCSSIGIEAVLMGKPLLILGESDYSEYMPKNQGFTVEEITKILETGVPVIPVSNLFPWALWQLRGGIELQLFSIDPGWRLRFGGKSVDEARIWYRVLKYIARKLRFFN
jgi:hypothetical protein